MLCNRRGGCFAEGCYKWGCPSAPGCCSAPTTGCCGGSPRNIFDLMTDPCNKKLVRNSMQLVYGAYCGGSCPPAGCCPPCSPCCPLPCSPCCPLPCPPVVSGVSPNQEPIRILFKCPTYCTPLPEPICDC